MMKKVYTIKDTNPMSWEEFGKILDSLIQKISNYQKQYDIKFDMVAPILRSGGIPATAIANKFKIICFLPVQIKYIYSKNDPTKVEHRQIFSLPEILQEVPSNPNILVCEANTGSGDSAKKSIALIREKYPASNIYYATVAKIYGGLKILNDVKEYFWGVQTNEFFKATDDEIKKIKPAS